MSSYHESDGFDDALALANGGAVDRRPSHPGPSSQPTDSVDWKSARATARRAAEPGEPVELPLHRAAHHTLAEPLTALTDLPAFDTSAMDGWAVAGPGPWTLDEGAGVLAGTAAPARLSDGQAVPIATGARIPPGATAVLRSEYGTVTSPHTPAGSDPDTTSGGTGRLTTRRSPSNGTDIRPRGQECRTGDLLLAAGTRVTPAALGLAAAAGYERLTVTRRPSVEILVLGAELLQEGVPRGGLIRDALGPLLGPWLTALGADVTAVRHLGDDADALEKSVATATADLVLTTGGTASGPVDHVRPLLARLGARLLVDSVEVRPGHPMLLAELPAHAEPTPGAPRHLVGLPGNPLAAVSGLLTLVEPYLRGLADWEPDAALPTARLTESVTGHPVDTRLVPVTRESRGVRPLHFHGPAMLRGVASASALAVIPPGGAARGSPVSLLTLPYL